MNGITILIWMTIAIIGIIAIILVKLHFKGDELEHEEGSILPSTESLNNMLSTGKSIISNNTSKNSSTKKHSNIPANLYKDNNQRSSGFDAYIVPEVENENTATYEYKNENQVLVNYGNTYEKFEEPIKENQMDIMTQNNDTKNEKTELKDLFTIDELIKESKRKDSEREKEAQTTQKEDEELSELKESIIRRKENPNLDDNLIEKIDEDGKEIKQESISELVEEDEKETSEVEEEIQQSSIAPKDIEEAISTASKESEEENVESISESNNITDVLLENPDGNEGDDELKAPKKIDEERKDYKFGADLESGNVFGSTDNDLDYRKDLAKVRNTIRSSKIFQDVKERLTPEPRETPDDETYIRNVNEYEDEFAPIINETHADFEASYEEYHDPHFDERVRQENTRRVFTKAKNASSGLEIKEPKIAEIKEKPVRENMKISLNNNDYVLKKGDEIIFNHQGETYSSQVYAIKGDDIYVRYRRKDITIKASDVKKIY